MAPESLGSEILSRDLARVKKEFTAPIFDVVVLGARKAEHQALVKEFANFAVEPESDLLSQQASDRGIYERAFSIRSGIEPPIGHDNKLINVGFVECSEMGNLSAAIYTAVRAASLKPALMIFAGIAGSLDCTKFRIGDVIFPRSITFRPFNKFKSKIDGETHPQEETIDSINACLHGEGQTELIDATVRDMMGHIDEKALSAELKSLDIPKAWCVSHDIPNRKPEGLPDEGAFSWDKVLSNSGYVKYLRQIIGNSATTVDMESFGFLKALKMCSSREGLDISTRGMIVRSVSDFAEFKDLTKSDKCWRELGLDNMAIATRFAVQTAFPKVFF